MDVDQLRERAGSLPREPGVYQFLDSDRVLYVGKAVDLRDRVRSYADPRSERIRQMVAAAEEIDIAVTDTESQALLLEANLIKRHRPKYNVRLKDDKSYPLVALTDHEFPRLKITRNPTDGSTVFGPFTEKGTVEMVCKALREIYGVRGCSDHKFAGRDRPCLDYDIGLCTAPCTGEIGDEAYMVDVESVERFFSGETGVLTDPLRRGMEQAAENEQFERAANLRDMLDAVERFRGSHDKAVSTAEEGGHRTDVLGVSLAGRSPTVAVLRAERGQLVDREQHTLVVPDDQEETAIDLPDPTDAGAVIGAFIPQYYAGSELPDTILCPEQPVGEGLDRWLASVGVELRVPGAGREATLVDLATKNARSRETTRDGSRALATALGTDRIDRIEGFDVSHAQGRAVVGSNVVFVDGNPQKPDYRRKKLAEENDDYANMRALLSWRAERAVEGRDDRPEPDLLLVDGGSGQLKAAGEALESAGWEVPVIALAKDKERVITPDRTYDWSSGDEKLQLLQRVRDESHRFARQYHQTLRDDVSTALDEIDGVGPATRKRLLGRFGSVEGVRAAGVDELQEIDGIGEQTAAKIDRQLS